MTTKSHRPPRLAERLLASQLRPEDRDAILGDLDEQFHRRIDRQGARGARRWYWCEAARLAWGFRTTGTGTGGGRHVAAMAPSELRYAVRRLLSQPVASVASAVTLALAIASGAVMWSVLSAVLFNPLRVSAPDRLVEVGRSFEAPQGTTTIETFAYRAYPAIRATGVFDGLAAGGPSPSGVTIDEGAARRTVFLASYDYFDTLGVRLLLGRGFSEQEDRRRQPLVGILSESFWRTAFGADPGVVGRTILVEGRPAVVIGVAPARFRGLDLTTAPDVYLPLHAIEQVRSTVNLFDEPNTGRSPTAWIRIVGRLSPQATLASTADRLNALALEEVRGAELVLTSVNTAAVPEVARAGVSSFAGLLGGTVGLILLTGCLTAGMYLLIRLETRRGELSVCMALGASRGRLLVGVALEAALLALLAAALAFPTTHWFFGALGGFELPGGVSLRLFELTLDPLVVAALAVIATTIVVSAAAAGGLAGVPGDGGQGDPHRSVTPRVTGRAVRTMLVSSQVAVAIALMAGTGLFARSVSRALALNPGFDTSRIVVGSLFLDLQGYDAARAAAFFDDLRTRLDVHPAVESVGFNYRHMAMSGGYPLEFDGLERVVPSTLEYVGIDERHFQTMGLSVPVGRDFTADDRAGAPLVAIVSQSLARFIAADGDPIGHRIASAQAGVSYEIVGVVPDVISRISRLEPLVAYLPIAQQTEWARREITVRAAGAPSQAMASVMEAVRHLDPAVTLAAPMRTLDDRMLEQMGPQRLGILVMGSLAGVALLLTLVGTYVLAASLASTRRREMGVRAALGATGWQLGRLILSETLRPIGIGILGGLALVWTGSATIRGFLFQVEPFDRLVLVGVLGAIVVLAMAASLRPARAAALVDLTRLIREE